jgi:ppGpp synthetase/RelA/SpoT-type nucleotidyltranferase
MSDPSSPADMYRAAKPFLDLALDGYKTWLEAGLTGVVSDFYVTGRVKTARSLVRKIRKEPSNPRSWTSIQDKVGLRVICSTKSDVKLVDEWLQAEGIVVVERTVKTGEHDRLFYPGIHFIVENGSSLDHIGDHIPCEIQLRTRAQDAWSVVSHKLLYKGLMKKRRRLPAYRPAMMLESLDERYESIIGEPSLGFPDLDLMLVLQKSYGTEERKDFETLIAEFCDSGGGALNALIRSHQPTADDYVDARDWLFTQPEILLVLERAGSKPYLLVEAVRNTDLEDVVRRSCVAAGHPLPTT